MPINQILSLPAGELMLWKQWLENEPRGARRIDWQFAALTKCVHDVAMGFAGKSNPLPLADYLLRFETVTPEQQDQRIQENLRKIFGNIIPAVKT